MDHDVICDCLFKGTCETYADPLIARSTKTSNGCGCQGQTDLYRSRHCKNFRCKYLSVVLSDMLKPKTHTPG